MRILKSIRSLVAAIIRRERARFDGLTAADADALIEASIRFGLERRIARRWWSILGGHVARMFRLSLAVPTGLVEAPTSPAAPAPVALRIVR